MCLQKFCYCNLKYSSYFGTNYDKMKNRKDEGDFFISFIENFHFNVKLGSCVGTWLLPLLKSMLWKFSFFHFGFMPCTSLQFKKKSFV